MDVPRKSDLLQDLLATLCCYPGVTRLLPFPPKASVGAKKLPLKYKAIPQHRKERSHPSYEQKGEQKTTKRK